VIATAGPSALWYLTRGTGLVTLLGLTASVVLGIVQVRRWTPGGSPRYVAVALHRGVSLLVVALLAVHVVTAVLDSFAPIRLLDAVVPFVSAYRPLWLGLGALALDGILALTITSLLRHRLGLRAWRAVHWIAYACWPVALVHGWGTGSDARTPWMLAITLGCAGAVLVAVVWRLGAVPEDRSVRRSAGAVGTLVSVGVLALWLVSGPLAPGWARRAGTPQPLLTAARAPRPTVTPAPIPALERPFTSGLEGSVHEGRSAGGTAVVDLQLRLTGGPGGKLRILVAGQSDAGGGVLMSRSAVTLGRLQGRIDQLQGTSLEALVGAPDGRAMRLSVDLALDGSSASGTISGRPVGA
jgi:sulfoxide reductase heme-binding subunit YedZ